MLSFSRPDKWACAMVFTGHMIDLPGRPTPRFAPSLEPQAASAIDAEVARVRAAHAPGAVVGLSSAARGGDLLFLEACARQEIETFVVIPFSPDQFARSSVLGVPTGRWPARYGDMIVRHTPDRLEVMGEAQSNEAFERCNLRLLELANLAAREVVLIALLQSQALTEQGGTAHFVAHVRDQGGEIRVIDPQKLAA